MEPLFHLCLWNSVDTDLDLGTLQYLRWKTLCSIKGWKLNLNFFTLRKSSSLTLGVQLNLMKSFSQTCLWLGHFHFRLSICYNSILISTNWSRMISSKQIEKHYSMKSGIRYVWDDGIDIEETKITIKTKIKDDITWARNGNVGNGLGPT